MLAMTKHDYDRTSKFDLSISGWGGEDVKFFEACVQAKVFVFEFKLIQKTVFSQVS